MSVLAAEAEPRHVHDDLEQHRVALTRHCTRMLGSRSEAEDAVQETLLRAWRRHGQFDGRGRLGSWLHRIATNICIDMLNARSRRPMPADPASLHAVPVEAGADTDPAEQALLQETFRLALLVAVQRLTTRQRAVLVLREALGWSSHEVAELLGTSDAAVNSALQRARASLRSGDPGGGAAPSTTAGGSLQQLLATCLSDVRRYEPDTASHWTSISP